MDVYSVEAIQRQQSDSISALRIDRCYQHRTGTGSRPETLYMDITAPCAVMLIVVANILRSKNCCSPVQESISTDARL